MQQPAIVKILFMAAPLPVQWIFLILLSFKFPAGHAGHAMRPFLDRQAF